MQERVLKRIKRRTWSWLGLGHANHVLQWTPRGRTTRGRPRNTCRRDLESEMGKAWFKYRWREMEATAEDRTGWGEAV